MPDYRILRSFRPLPLLLALALVPACAGAPARPETPPPPAKAPSAQEAAPMPPATAPHMGLRERLEAALEETDPARRATLLESLMDELPEETDVRGFVAGLLVQTYAELGRLDEMAAAARSAPLRDDVATADMLNAMAYAYAEAGRHLTEAYVRVGQALDILDVIGGRIPADAADARRQLELRRGAYLDTLGWVYYGLGRLPDARKALESATASFDNSESSYHLGEVLLAQGERDAAARRLARAVVLGGEGADKARKALSEMKGVDADALIREAEAQVGPRP